MITFKRSIRYPNNVFPGSGLDINNVDDAKAVVDRLFTEVGWPVIKKLCEHAHALFGQAQYQRSACKCGFWR
jgi:hypothetical protein